MATYTPKSLAPTAALTASAATIYTATAVVGIIRTITAQSATAAQNFTLAQGTDGVATRIFDAYVLTVNIPAIFNGWWAITASGIVQAKSNSTNVQLSLNGYEYA